MPTSFFYRLFIGLGGLLLLSGCTEETSEEERDQEQRYFDIYVNSRYPDAEPRPSGLYFVEHRKGQGVSPGEDDWMLINYVATFIPQERIFETYLENVARDNGIFQEEVLYGPYKFQNGTTAEGIREGLSLMQEGSQSILLFTSDLGYGSRGLGGSIPAFQSLKYEVELFKVIGDIVAYEQERLDTYLGTIRWTDTIHDPSVDATVYLVVDEPSGGSEIARDSVVKLAYTGYLIDGRVFDERSAEDPFEFTVGSPDVIGGWNLGITGFRNGESGRMIVPYPLAYGDGGRKTGSGLTTIPPYEHLIFEIEVVAVNDNSSITGPVKK